jgi:hypothetical protein
MAELVLSTLDDQGVLTLTFNRPETLNAWTGALGRRYFDLLAEAEANPGVRVVVVTGAGKGFCSGADFKTLSAIQSGSYDEVPDRARTRTRRRSASRSSRPSTGPARGSGWYMRWCATWCSPPRRRSGRRRSRAGGWSPSTGCRGCCPG